MVQSGLTALGYSAPGVELIHKEIGNSVKYDADCREKWPGIEQAANRLAGAANEILRKNGWAVEPLQVKSFNLGCKVPNTLELWIAFAPAPKLPPPRYVWPHRIKPIRIE
jgi:hypothetical protein